MQYRPSLFAELRASLAAVLFAVLPLAAPNAPASEGFPDPPSIDKHMVETGKEVHQWITREAWRYFSSEIAGAELDRFIGVWGVDGIFTDLGQLTVLDGARDEDKGQKPPLFQGNPMGDFDLDAPALRHFCASAKDMYTGYLLGIRYDSNLTQAERIWQNNTADNLTLRYAQPDKTTAYYYLGHVAHLLQDMTIPAHTHNDPHGSNLVGVHDSYEQDYAATNFRNFRYDNAVAGQYVLKDRPINIPASLFETFQQTADYTDDYDSNHADGEFVTGGLDACFFPADFPSAQLHRPNEAIRTGGGGASTMSEANCAIIANDLMYWSIKRTAQLFRYFYKEFDTEAFRAEIRLSEQGMALSQDETAPSPYFGPRKALLRVSYKTATRTDFPASGIVRNSCVLHYLYNPGGGSWSEEHTLSFTENPCLASLPTQPGIYRVWITAENGAGQSGETVYGYFRAPGFALAQAPVGGRVERGEPLRLFVSVSDG